MSAEAETLESLRAAYTGRRATVMGLGHFGGGVGAARFLAEHGARVTVTDQKRADQLQAPLRELQGWPIERIAFGPHCEADFDQADLIVASPAIRPDHPLLERARRAGIPVTTEIGLFWKHCPASIIGVTGTVGKSTTSALIHHLVAASGSPSWLGGNIGGSLLTQLTSIQPGDTVVLELSSFQLMYLDREGRSPAIAVVTNLWPNHLDWHRSYEEYRHAKQTLLRHQTLTNVAILPQWSESLTDWRGPGQIVRVSDDPQLESLELPSLPGRHNRRNLALAWAAVKSAGSALAPNLSDVTTFRGLPHRLEFLGERQGRRFYNDSKATTPEAAIAALSAFESPVVVLAGGSDKQVDLQPLASELERRAKSIALMGATAGILDRLLDDGRSGSAPARRVTTSLREAFHWAAAQSSLGDVILLSPGCASFGWFRDYADRGDQFRQLFEELPR
ncbi:MAG: UDP-N-acetylmuramoyl-L-alanine--D-glutamate ligase [Planctomycetaceae bacterium]